MIIYCKKGPKGPSLGVEDTPKPESATKKLTAVIKNIFKPNKNT